MDGRWQSDQDAPLIREFFRLLAVCHTVIPEGPPTPLDIRYQVMTALRHSLRTPHGHAIPQAPHLMAAPGLGGSENV